MFCPSFILSSRLRERYRPHRHIQCVLGEQELSEFRQLFWRQVIEPALMLSSSLCRPTKTRGKNFEILLLCSLSVLSV